MVAIRGLGSGVGGTKRMGLSDEDIRGIIVAEVAVTIRETILELIGSVKTTLIEEFDQSYVIAK